MKKYIIIGISVCLLFTVLLIFAFVKFMEELEYGWKHRSEGGSKSTQIYEKFLNQLEKKDLDNYYVISNYNHYI